MENGGTRNKERPIPAALERVLKLPRHYVVGVVRLVALELL